MSWSPACSREPSKNRLGFTVECSPDEGDVYRVADLHGAVRRRRFADLCVLEQVTQLLDAGLEFSLLLASGVIAAVLLQVALFARCGDLLDDLRPATSWRVFRTRREVGRRRLRLTRSSWKRSCCLPLVGASACSWSWVLTSVGVTTAWCTPVLAVDHFGLPGRPVTFRV